MHLLTAVAGLQAQKRIVRPLFDQPKILGRAGIGGAKGTADDGASYINPGPVWRVSLLQSEASAVPTQR